MRFSLKLMPKGGTNTNEKKVEKSKFLCKDETISWRFAGLQSSSGLMEVSERQGNP